MQLSRRAIVASALALTLPPRPAPAAVPQEERLQSIASSVRAKGDAGITSWGQPWSGECSWSASPPKPSSVAAPLPRWLQGRWKVTSSLDEVSFPLGRSFLNERVPGIRMVSILSLPNIGSTPTFEVQYDATIESQRAANAKATLEAFWPAASVVDLSVPPTGNGVRLTYSSPTRSKAKVEQSANVAVCASEGGSIGEEYVLAEVFQQDNLEQGIRTEYEVITRFERLEGMVRAKQRVAAFLQPTDGQYFDAQGKPVVLYDYSYAYERIG